MLQLLKNLRRSVATLDVCGEWGTGDSANDEAALEVRTDRIWMEGRAQQKRFSALQVSCIIRYPLSKRSVQQSTFSCSLSKWSLICSG